MIYNRFASGIAAGASIALAAYAALLSGEITGTGRLAAAAVFPLGLLLVLKGGFDLFTGRCMTLVTERMVALPALAMSWVANLVGALTVVHVLHPAPVIFATTAQAKIALCAPDAFLFGVCCNMLVCTGIVLWHRVGVVGAYVPVFLFVFCGFEHSVADMFYLGAGLSTTGVCAAAVTLAWVTLGNVLGGLLVGIWKEEL